MKKVKVTSRVARRIVDTSKAELPVDKEIVAKALEGEIVDYEDLSPRSRAIVSPSRGEQPVANIRVTVLMVKKRASRKHQEVLRRVLQRYGFDPKGSFMYIAQDGGLGFFLQGMETRTETEKICREVLVGIN